MKPHPAPSQDHADQLVARIRQALERLIPSDTQVPDRILAEKAQGLLYCIVARAADFFAYCPDDFCIGSINDSDGVIVFGGTNRLIWNSKSGYHPDPPYCTAKFLEQFEGEVWKPIGRLTFKDRHQAVIAADNSYSIPIRTAEYPEPVQVPIDARFHQLLVFGRNSTKGDGKLAEIRFNTGVEA